VDGDAIVARDHDKNLRLEERPMWGWIFFALLLIWYFVHMRYILHKMMNLESYIVFLLLSDDIRADHKNKFQQWISNSKATHAGNLRVRASSALQLLADSLAEKGSALSSSAFIWKYKRESDSVAS
jgi:hypothetical protein